MKGLWIPRTIAAAILAVSACTALAQAVKVTITPEDAQVFLHDSLTQTIQITNESQFPAHSIQATIRAAAQIDSFTTGSVVTSGVLEAGRKGKFSPALESTSETESVQWNVGSLPPFSSTSATLVITPTKAQSDYQNWVVLLHSTEVKVVYTIVQGSGISVAGEASASANFDTVKHPGPDLIARWNNIQLKQRCGRNCKLKVKLGVVNIGTVPAPASVVRVYVSNDKEYSADDTPIKQIGLSPLNKYSIESPAYVKKFNIRVAGTIPVAGKYILFLLDADNQIAEGSEFNNTIVIGPLN